MPPNWKYAIVVLFGVALLLPTQLSAQVILTKDAALKLYFPTAKTIERKTIFLTDEQVQMIQDISRTKVDSKIITYYIDHEASGIGGYAFIETRTMRTMPATFMIVMLPDGTVRSVELLAFYEPEDYKPPAKWLQQFQQKNISNDLWLKRGIQNIAGATISAYAITDAVRRIVSTFELAIPKENK